MWNTNSTSHSTTDSCLSRLRRRVGRLSRGRLAPRHYFDQYPGLDAMLLLTKVNLDLLEDSDMYQFFERGIRGGQSVIFEKYCKANNKY